MSSIQRNPALPAPMKIGMWILGVFFAIFGLLTMQFAYAIAVGSMPWSTTLTMMIVDYLPDTEPGLITLSQAHSQYHELVKTMSTHSLVGGVVVALGILQFVPSIRRNHRQLHRAMGAMLALFMAGVSVTALYFLAIIPPTQILAGQAFYIVLLALAALSLAFLAQAGLAAMSKDFRSHMVWMGLTFSCFLTAPILRYNYILVGAFDTQNINRLVQNSVPSVLLQGFLLFMIWLCLVGDKDLPPRTNQALWRMPQQFQKLLILSAAISVLIVAAMGVYAFDANFFIVNQSVVTIGVLLVALAKIAQVMASQAVWLNGYEGKRPTGLFAASTAISAIALFWLASTLNKDNFHAHTVYYGLVNFAVIELITLGLAYLTKPLKNGAHLFAMASAALSWMWLGMPGMIMGIYLSGFEFPVAIISAFVLVPPTFMAFAVLVATGVGLFTAVKQKTRH